MREVSNPSPHFEPGVNSRLKIESSLNDINDTVPKQWARKYLGFVLNFSYTRLSEGSKTKVYKIRTLEMSI